MEDKKDKSQIEEYKDKLRNAIKDNKTYKSDHIYLINEQVIARGKNSEDSRNEYAIGKYLLEHKVNVPETYGLIKPDTLLSRLLNKEDTPIDKYFVTFKKIDGEEIRNLEGNLKEFAKQQYKKEIKKVLALGLCPEVKFWTGDPLFNIHEGKVYLTNFEGWYAGSEEEIHQAHLDLKFRHRIWNQAI